MKALDFIFSLLYAFLLGIGWGCSIAGNSAMPLWLLIFWTVFVIIKVTFAYFDIVIGDDE